MIGLVIRPAQTTSSSDIPYYFLTRLSATHENENWYQEHGPPIQRDAEDATIDAATEDTATATAIPQWTDYIRRTTLIQVPVSIGLTSAGDATAARDDFGTSDDSSSDNDSDEEDLSDAEGEPDDEMDDDDSALDVDGAETQVYPYRLRIWGLAASPGGGTSVALVSQHSTQRPERVCRTMALFSWHETDKASQTTGPVREGLSTEGKAWERMYANGPRVSGLWIDERDNDNKNKKDNNDNDGATTTAVMPSVLAAQLLSVRSTQRCAYCNTALYAQGQYVRCHRNHMFGESASGATVRKADC